MKNRTRQLLPLILLCQTASAHDASKRESLPYNFYANPFSAVDHFDEQADCGGYLRAGYIRSSIRSPKTVSASAVGGEFGCSFSINNHAKVHLALFGSADTGLNHHDDDNIQGDFFNDKKDSYLLLGEAYLILSFDAFEAHLGRQRLDTPHMNNDDLRIIPNLFEAYLVDFHLTENLHAGTGFVRAMAGWENGGDSSHFERIGTTFGGAGRHAWLGWLRNEGDQLTSNLWYYRIPDHLHIVYGDITHNGDLSRNISYSLSFQYDWGNDIGSRKLGIVDAKTWGVSTSLSFQELTISLAYNKNNSAYGALPSLGGGAFFTSMEDQTLDAIAGKKAAAALIALEYSATKKLTLGSAFGQFRAEDKSQYDTEEINLYLTYNLKYQSTFELTCAQVKDKNSSGSDHQLRAILSHNY